MVGIKSEWNDGISSAPRQRPRLEVGCHLEGRLRASGAGAVHNTHEALLGNTGFTVTWCYNGLLNAPSTTNPVYSMTAIFPELPVGGAVNEVMEAAFSYMLSTGAVTVTTA